MLNDVNSWTTVRWGGAEHMHTKGYSNQFPRAQEKASVKSGLNPIKSPPGRMAEDEAAGGALRRLWKKPCRRSSTTFRRYRHLLNTRTRGSRHRTPKRPQEPSGGRWDKVSLLTLAHDRMRHRRDTQTLKTQGYGAAVGLSHASWVGQVHKYNNCSTKTILCRCIFYFGSTGHLSAKRASRTSTNSGSSQNEPAYNIYGAPLGATYYYVIWGSHHVQL